MFVRGWASLRGLPRGVWVLCIASFANRVGTMALPYLVLYLTGPRGFSTAQAGTVMSVYGATAFVAGWLAGRLCDRFGPVTILRVTLIAAALVLCLYPLAHSFQAVLVATVAWSICAEGFRPAVLTAVAQNAPGALRKPAYALMRLSINLGMSVGPAVGGFLAVVSFPAIFIVDGLTSLIASLLLISAFPRQATIASAVAEIESPPQELTPRLQGRSLTIALALILAGGFLIACSYFQCEAVLGLHLTRDLQLPAYALGLVFTLNTLLIVALEVPLNAATARWSHRRTLMLGASLMGAGFAVYAVAFSAWSIACGTIVWTFGEMILFPSIPAFLAAVAPPDKQGRVMALYPMSWSAAFIVAPLTGLAIYERAGSPAVWLTVAGACAVAALLYSRLRH